jgi:hypothetical protein
MTTFLSDNASYRERRRGKRIYEWINGVSACSLTRVLLVFLTEMHMALSIAGLSGVTRVCHKVAIKAYSGGCCCGVNYMRRACVSSLACRIVQLSYYDMFREIDTYTDLWSCILA